MSTHRLVYATSHGNGFAPRGARRAATPGPLASLAATCRLVLRWYRDQQTRHEIDRLDPRIRRDIGLVKSDV